MFMDTKFVKNIIFPGHIEKYDEEVITDIKNKAQWHGQHIKRYINQGYVVQRSIELANSVANQNLTGVQKLIFISNSVFTNDESFLNLMKENNWTDEKTEQLNDLLFKIKIYNRHNKDIDFDLSLLEEIQKISKKCFGISNPVVLINRINELSVTQTYAKVKTKKYWFFVK